MMKLDPNARANRRYLMIRGRKSEIEHALRDYLGVLGMVRADAIFVSEQKDLVILAVNREMVIHVRAAFGLSKHEISVLGVSGTLKKLNYAKLK